MTKTPLHLAGPDCLAVYSKVPISFWVRRELAVELVDAGLGGIRLTERPVEPPYLRDYDRYYTPLHGSDTHDLHNWGFFLAGDPSALVGAASVAYDTPSVTLLEGRRSAPSTRLPIQAPLRVTGKPCWCGTSTCDARLAERYGPPDGLAA